MLAKRQKKNLCRLGSLFGILFILSCQFQEPLMNIEEAEKKANKGHDVSQAKPDSLNPDDYVMYVADEAYNRSTTGTYVESLYTIVSKSAITAAPSPNLILIPVDLNKRAGGKYVYACYMRSNQYAISNISIRSNSNPFANIDIPADHDPVWIYGQTSTGCADLNDGAGGDYIYAYQSYHPRFGSSIIDVGVITGTSSLIEPPLGWIKVNKDLNAGAGGDYIYFIYKRETQSSTLDFLDEIPAMTSNSTPSGVCTASSSYNAASYDAWRAFDGYDQSGTWSRWISSVSSAMPQWLSYQFSTTKTIRNYYLLPECGGTVNDRMPKNFQLQAFNGDVWVTLDSRSNVTYWTTRGNYFSVSNPGAYNLYRLYITATNGSPVVSIRQFKMDM